MTDYKAVRPRSITNLLFDFRICSGVGITLTFVAGIIRMATAIPGISNLGKNEQFWLCFLAQLLNGMYLAFNSKLNLLKKHVGEYHIITRKVY